MVKGSHHTEEARIKLSLVRIPDDERYDVDSNGCWLYNMSINSEGYGTLHTTVEQGKYKTMPAHKYFYEKMVGKVPKGKVIDHLCRVRHCVNPAHMEIVTTAENTRRGICTKLNIQKVEKIRELSKQGLTQRPLAKMFGISQVQIGNIVRQEQWNTI